MSNDCVPRLLWAGASAAAAGRSVGSQYHLEGVRPAQPEIVLPHDVRGRSSEIKVSHADPTSQMIRLVGGLRTTGVEATLLRLAHLLDEESFEVACEDARRRRLTSIPALRAYLQRFGQRGRPGVARLRALLAELDPRWPSRSKLEVLTRRLLVANGLTDFVREHPLIDGGQELRYDFTFLRERVDPRDQREAVARRRHRLPTGPTQVERPRTPRLPARIRDVVRRHRASGATRHRHPGRADGRYERPLDLDTPGGRLGRSKALKSG